jgi:hypothetical protein
MIWREGTFVVWAVVVLVLVGCQAVAVATRGRLPTVGALVRWSNGGPIRRGLVVLAWMWVGWHTFAR